MSMRESGARERNQVADMLARYQNPVYTNPNPVATVPGTD